MVARILGLCMLTFTFFAEAKKQVELFPIAYHNNNWKILLYLSGGLDEWQNFTGSVGAASQGGFAYEKALSMLKGIAGDCCKQLAEFVSAGYQEAIGTVLEIPGTQDEYHLFFIPIEYVEIRELMKSKKDANIRSFLWLNITTLFAAENMPKKPKFAINAITFGELLASWSDIKPRLDALTQKILKKTKATPIKETKSEKSNVTQTQKTAESSFGGAKQGAKPVKKVKKSAKLVKKVKATSQQPPQKKLSKKEKEQKLKKQQQEAKQQSKTGKKKKKVTRAEDIAVIPGPEEPEKPKNTEEPAQGPKDGQGQGLIGTARGWIGGTFNWLYDKVWGTQTESLTESLKSQKKSEEQEVSSDQAEVPEEEPAEESKTQKKSRGVSKGWVDTARWWMNSAYDWIYNKLSGGDLDKSQTAEDK